MKTKIKLKWIYTRYTIAFTDKDKDKDNQKTMAIMDIAKQFPTMIQREGGGGMAFYISAKSWRGSPRISGKIFQDRCVVQPTERVTKCRRNTTRIKTRPITSGDSSVVDWFTGKACVATKRDAPNHYTTNQTNLYTLSNKSWRVSVRVSGKIFRERCIDESCGRLSIRPRVVVSQITLDDERVVNYLEEENTFNPSAIYVFPSSKQEIDITKYYHEERTVGIGSGNVKDRRPRITGIDMACDAIGWKGREHYTDEQFFRWKKPATLKAKDMTREDFNVYQRILKTMREQRPLPK